MNQPSLIRILILSVSLLGFIACGPSASETEANTSIEESESAESRPAAKPKRNFPTGSISEAALEGRWKRIDKTVIELSAGEFRTMAGDQVLRKESYEVTDSNSCTQESDGPYLIVKGGAKTCYKLLRADNDSLIYQLSPVREPIKYGRID